MKYRLMTMFTIALMHCIMGREAPAQDLVNCIETGPSSNVISRIYPHLKTLRYDVIVSDAPTNSHITGHATTPHVMPVDRTANIYILPEVAYGYETWKIDYTCREPDYNTIILVPQQVATVNFLELEDLTGSVDEASDESFIFTPSECGKGFICFEIEYGSTVRRVKLAMEVIDFERRFITGSKLDPERTKVGIAEKIHYEILPRGSDITANWEYPKKGKTVSAEGDSIYADASDTPGQVSIRAEYKGFTYTDDLTVVVPSKPYAKKALEEIHVNKYCGDGFVANLYFGPFDVSFENVKWMEGKCTPSKATGLWSFYAGHEHGGGYWCSFPAPKADASPVSCSKQDNVVVMNRNQVRNSGLIQFDIPYIYSVGFSDEEHQFTMCIQKHVTTTSGKTTTSKFDSESSCEWNAPTKELEYLVVKREFWPLGRLTPDGHAVYKARDGTITYKINGEIEYIRDPDGKIIYRRSSTSSAMNINSLQDTSQCQQIEATAAQTDTAVIDTTPLIDCLTQQYDDTNEELQYFLKKAADLFDISIQQSVRMDSMEHNSMALTSEQRRERTEQWFAGWQAMHALCDPDWNPDDEESQTIPFIPPPGSCDFFISGMSPDAIADEAVRAAYKENQEANWDMRLYNNRQMAIRNIICQYRIALELAFTRMYAQPPYDMDELKSLLEQLDDQELQDTILAAVEPYVREPDPNIEALRAVWNMD